VSRPYRVFVTIDEEQRLTTLLAKIGHGVE
jgi:hypothetical protein